MKKIMALMLIVLCMAAGASAENGQGDHNANVLEVNTALVDIEGEQFLFKLENAEYTTKWGVRRNELTLNQYDTRAHGLLRTITITLPANWEEGKTYAVGDKANAVYGTLRFEYLDRQTGRKYLGLSPQEFALIIDAATDDYTRLQGRMKGTAVETLPTSTMLDVKTGEHINIGESYFDFDLSSFTDFANIKDAREKGPVEFAPLE